MEKTPKVDADNVAVAAQCAVEFWATIDGNKLARVGQKEKDMDIVGTTKRPEVVRYA